jgi:hypothetical protein
MTKCEPTDCKTAKGEYSQRGAFEKTQCVKSCDATRANSVNDLTSGTCVCNSGFFSKTPSASCERTPVGADCDKGCTPADFQLQPGFWRTGPSSSQVTVCPVAELCPQATGRANASACADGHTGAMCTVCADGWARSTGLHCETCEGGDHAAFGVWLALILLGLPLAYGGLRWFKRRGSTGSSIANATAPNSMTDKLKSAQGSMRNMGMKLQAGLTVSAYGREVTLQVGDSWWRTMTVQLKIMVTFLQVLSQIHTVYDIPYPESFVRFIQRMAFVNLDLIDMMRVGCVARVDFYGKLFAVTLVPIILSAGLFVVARYKVAVRNTCIKVFLLLTFIIFPSVSTTVLRAFPCRAFDDGSNLLKADYSIDCDAPGRAGYVFYAVLMTLVYPIGITTLYAVLLWKQRLLVCPEKREWQKVCGIKAYPPLSLSIADDDALLAAREALLKDKSAGAHAMLRSTQFLFKEYEPRFWWFEVFECARRLMLTGGTVFFLEGSATQVAAGMLVALISIQIYARTQPYIRHQDDTLAMAAQWGIYFTLFIGLLLKARIPSADGYDGVLGGLLIFVNAMVIVLAIGTFLYLLLHNEAAKSAKESSAEPAPRTASSSVSNTTGNPMMAAAAQSGGSGKPLSKGGSSSSSSSSSSKQNSASKLSKRARDIYAATNPATQGDDSEPKPTAHL